MIHAALDTSLGFSFAVADDDKLIFQESMPGIGRESDRLLIPWIVENLKKFNLHPNDIKAWTVGTGPGSFAGLRCGIALIKGFIAVSQAKLRGVPSSCAIASQCAAPDAPQAAVLHDGRCGQVIPVYLKRQGNTWVLTGTPEPVYPDALDSAVASYTTAQADTIPTLPEAIQQRLATTQAVAAEHLLFADYAVWPWPATPEALEESITPLYVRQAVFVKPAILRVENESK